jgi:aryl-alcohol dehydrogenase-like predicted oxidoreductase
MSEQADRVVAAVAGVAAERGRTPAQVAIRWVLDHAEISSVLIGPDLPEHVDDVLGAVGWSLSLEERAALDDASAVALPRRLA